MNARAPEDRATTKPLAILRWEDEGGHLQSKSGSDPGPHADSPRPRAQAAKTPSDGHD